MAEEPRSKSIAALHDALGVASLGREIAGVASRFAALRPWERSAGVWLAFEGLPAPFSTLFVAVCGREALEVGVVLMEDEVSARRFANGYAEGLFFDEAGYDCRGVLVVFPEAEEQEEDVEGLFRAHSLDAPGGRYPELGRFSGVGLTTVPEAECASLLAALDAVATILEVRLELDPASAPVTLSLEGGDVVVRAARLPRALLLELLADEEAVPPVLLQNSDLLSPGARLELRHGEEGELGLHVMPGEAVAQEREVLAGLTGVAFTEADTAGSTACTAVWAWRERDEAPWLLGQLVPEAAEHELEALELQEEVSVCLETGAPDEPELRVAVRVPGEGGEEEDELAQEALALVELWTRRPVKRRGAPAAAKVGRNDPCPCGSGKKHKRCCLGTARARPPEALAAELYAQERDLAARVFRHSMDTLAEDVTYWGGAVPLQVGDDPTSCMLIGPYLLYVLADEVGRTVTERYAEDHPLDEGDERWLAAQAGASFSLYEVREIRNDVGVLLRELSSGEERFAYDLVFADMLAVGTVIACRLVELEGLTLFCGQHPAWMPLENAERVLEESRQGFEEMQEGARTLSPDVLLLLMWDAVTAGLEQAP